MNRNIGKVRERVREMDPADLDALRKNMQVNFAERFGRSIEVIEDYDAQFAMKEVCAGLASDLIFETLPKREKELVSAALNVVTDELLMDTDKGAREVFETLAEIHMMDQDIAGEAAIDLLMVSITQMVSASKDTNDKDTFAARVDDVERVRNAMRAIKREPEDYFFEPIIGWLFYRVQLDKYVAYINRLNGWA